MEHTKSSFYFTSKDDKWQVDYTYYIKNYYGQDHSELKVTVYLNNELYWDFERKPYTKTFHSTQGQAKEIISAARKLYKENYKLRDDSILHNINYSANRDKKLSKLGINNS